MFCFSELIATGGAFSFCLELDRSENSASMKESLVDYIPLAIPWKKSSEQSIRTPNPRKSNSTKKTLEDDLDRAIET